MSTSITLYDIASTIPGKSFSPHSWKARYALNYKGIPYTTSWLEHPEVEGKSQELGASHTGTKPDGNPFYTCPFLHDASTGAVISESSAIIEYLDATYPHTPRLVPDGTRVLQNTFTIAFKSQLDALWQFALPATNAILNPKGEAYFRRTREARFGGKRLEDVVPKGGERDEQWAKVRDGFGEVDAWIGKGQRFVMGDTLSAADLDIAGILIWCRKIWGEDSEEWKDIVSWHDGRWGTLLETLKAYETIL